MDLVSFLAGVVTLAAAFLVLPISMALVEKRRQRNLEDALFSPDPEVRGEARDRLSQMRVESASFAFALLRNGDVQTKLDIAPLFLEKRGALGEAAVDALGCVACEGDEYQRQSALMYLLLAPRRSQSIVKPLTERLPIEPVLRVRIDTMLLLATMAKEGSPDDLDSSLRTDVVKAVVGVIGSDSDEARACATACLLPNGPLAPFIAGAEVTLMALLRSPRQDVVDWTARVILAHRKTLKHAMSCIPASRASADLVDLVG